MSEQQAKLAPVPLEAGPATIYHRSQFNYRRLEVRELSVSTERYAQYQRALRIEFVEKGKRRRYAMQQSYRPEVVILAGHGHPVPADAFEDRGGGCSMSRHLSHGPEWSEEFQALIGPYLAERPGVLLADYRDFDTQAR
jgi:hypothetical protein